MRRRCYHGGQDPRWIKSGYTRECAGCRRTIGKAERVFFYPLTQAAYCNNEICGLQADRDFEASVADEMMDRSW
jgi:peroxiredoxin